MLPSIPSDALVLTELINSETFVSEVVWSAAGRNALNRQTPQNGDLGNLPTTRAPS